MKMVGAYTTGKNIPSARFRVRQYKDVLMKNGVEIKEYYTKYSSYPPIGKFRRVDWGIKNLISRVKQVEKSSNYEVNLIQKLFLSKYITLEKFVKNRVIFDVDDAIWTYTGEKNIEKICKLSDKVICGNEFLADYFSMYNKNVVILPTGVNTSRFNPDNGLEEKGYLTVGWSGSSSGLKYVYEIEEQLKKVVSSKVHLLIISDKKPMFKELNCKYVDYIKWSEFNEVKSLQMIDIGIMPLKSDIFSMGKCSYKMLLYMACGKPVVVSKVGMNEEVLKEGNVGFGVEKVEQWSETLKALINSDNLRKCMGLEGRKVVLNKYSVEVIGTKLAEVLKEK